MRKLVAMVVFSVLAGADLCGQTNALKPSEAKDHIGERATVCGRVVSGHFAEKSKGQPTFLNLDEPYPKQIFTIVIWAADREKFGTPETKYEKSRVCVTGKITSYRNEPEVTATNPNQIVIQK
jgi:hypothetical protein